MAGCGTLTTLMLPVLFTFGEIPISSFGLFLALAFLASVLTIWKIARAYEIDPEKILDLVLITFLIGLLVSRVYFVALNWELYNSLQKAVLINRYPGLSFWGGMLGGFLALWFLVKRYKLRFWEIADFASVAFLTGMVIGDLGCFLGGCAYGKISNLFIATPIVGLIGKRFPSPILEAILLLFVLLYLKKMVMKFHFAGKVVALFMIFTGVVKFILEYFRGDTRTLIWQITFGQVLSVLSIVIGTTIFYSLSKRDFKKDLIGFLTTPFDPKDRSDALLQLKKSWYNQLVATRHFYKGIGAFLRRRLNVKSTPKEY